MVVLNLERPLPENISVRGSGETLSVSYLWLPPRCLECQKWSHTEKNCTRNKKSKDTEKASNVEDTTGKSDDLEIQPVVVDGVVKENSKAIDMVKPVMEGAKLDIDETIAQGSSTKEDIRTKNMPANGEPAIDLAQKSSANADNTENEDWLTIPQSKSSSARWKLGKSGMHLTVEISTGSPSRYHLLSTELEEERLRKTVQRRTPR